MGPNYVHIRGVTDKGLRGKILLRLNVPLITCFHFLLYHVYLMNDIMKTINISMELG